MWLVLFGFVLAFPYFSVLIVPLIPRLIYSLILLYLLSPIFHLFPLSLPASLSSATSPYLSIYPPICPLIYLSAFYLSCDKTMHISRHRILRRLRYRCQGNGEAYHVGDMYFFFAQEPFYRSYLVVSRRRKELRRRGEGESSGREGGGILKLRISASMETRYVQG